MLTGAFPRRPFVWMLGNYPPRRCGIATFSFDLSEALELNGTPCRIAAMDDGGDFEYPEKVEVLIRQDELTDYIEAANRMNQSRASAVFVQHEFGIFGGEAGSHLITFLRFVELPVITTLHTVLEHPSESQRMVIEEVLSRSERVVVMSRRAKEILRRVYGREDNIVVIPHGVPPVPPMGRGAAKRSLGWSGRKVVLTFGLLSPDKGIETMIEAMAKISRAEPDALYVIAGQTHPHIKRQHGEAYRESLERRVEELALGSCVQFVNRFTELDELCTMLIGCDLYSTPYLRMEQITSGTLSYAVGMGRCVVSTPYWHAEELLANGPGRLVPARDADGFASAIIELLQDEERRHGLEADARRLSALFQWPRIASKYLRLVAEVWTDHHEAASADLLPGRPDGALPIRHLSSLTDDTGLFQHAKFDVPNRHEGYCTDDNARALLFLWRTKVGDVPPAERDRIERICLSFVFHAWNSEEGSFRNFMAFDRTWLESAGSLDCQGRTLWALALGATKAWTPGRRSLSHWLFEQASPGFFGEKCPRLCAHLLLAYAERERWRLASRRMTEDGRRIVGMFRAMLEEHSSPDWTWFEGELTYDNARLSHALIQWGMAAEDSEAVDLGLRTLRWLRDAQIAEGCFAPIGNEGFWPKGHPRPLYDQQPIEALASIEAYLGAHQATSDAEWLKSARQAHGWFTGHNLLGALMVDFETGACYDGLERTGPNGNQGAEACLSFLTAAALMESLAEVSELDPARLSLL